ncbi:MAG: hypothetical protein ACF8PN_09815 [Phycisphaerales bacterium]
MTTPTLARRAAALAAGTTLMIAMSATTSARADGFADFDDLTEGFQNYTVETGGIVFWDSRVFFPDPPAIFVVEDASGYIPGVPDIADHFSPPNVFQTSGFITGGSYLITRWAEVSMTTGQVENYVYMDVFYKDDPEFSGTEMVLEARLNGVPVAEVSKVIDDPRRDVRATSFEISGVEFDTVRLFGRGNQIPQLSGFLGSVDNVEISGGGPGSTLDLQLPTPGTPGQPASISATGATPGERVYFAWSLREGATPIPQCPGMVSDLQRPEVLGSAVADAGGVATLDFTVPEAAHGRNAFFQAVEPGACVMSDFVPFTFEPE